MKGGGSPSVVGAHGTPLEVATSVAIRKLLTPASAAPSGSDIASSSSSKKSKPQTNGSSEKSAVTTTNGKKETETSSAAPQTATVHETPAPLVRMASKKYHWTVDYAEISLGPQIGSGGFGVVFKGTWRGIDVAVKCLKGEVREDELSVFMHEVNVMSRLRHQNILLFVGACLEGPEVCFLTEYIPHGNLRKVLDVERLPPLKKLNMAIEATRGLAYLHSQTPAVLHRDLKSANVLVDDNYHIKLADFGLSRAVTLHAPGDTSSGSLADLISRRNTFSASSPTLQELRDAEHAGKLRTESSDISHSTPASGTSSATKSTSSTVSTQSTAPTTNGTTPSPIISKSGSRGSPATDTASTSTNHSNNPESTTKGKQDATDASVTPFCSDGGSSSEEARNTNSSAASAPVGSPKAPTSASAVDILEQAGTLYTTAPEVLTGAEYSKEADVYALGIIFWELATEKIPFMGLDPLQMLFEIVERSLPVPTEMGSQFGSLINDMLAKDPALRPTIPQIQERLKLVRAQLGELR